jgi:hypothetical protein
VEDLPALVVEEEQERVSVLLGAMALLELAWRRGVGGKR